MDFFGQIIQFLDFEITTPKAYGLFHIISILLSIGLGILLCMTHKNAGEQRVRRVVAIVAILVALLEAYKQFIFTFEFENGVLTKDFQWYAFPWQFCSTPMYVGLLTLVFRKGRIHRALISFLATYALFAGICVMVYPGDVFIETLGIDIQTMVCHGSMITVAIYLWYTNYVAAKWKTVLYALPVFACAVGVAMLLNEIAYTSGLLETDTFNMFFISPHCDPSLPVYSSVQAIVPYPFCLIIYIAGFTFAAGLMCGLVMLIKWVAEKIKRRCQA